MSQVSNKHGESSQRVFYSGFNGGLNLSVPSESLPLNELTEAMNVEFSSLTGSIRVRGGFVWSGRFSNKVLDVVPVAGKRGFLAKVAVGKTSFKLQYFTYNSTWNVSGASLTGKNRMSIVPWGDDEYLIASGGKLQIFRPRGATTGMPELETLTKSPDNCRLVFTREGRAGVVDGPDTLRFSWIGDCSEWADAASLGAVNDDSKGQFIEIGYKDGMDIVAVVPLSKDLIVFKTPGTEPDKGTVFRLTGDFPDWQVLEAAHNTGTYSQQSVQAVGNDVYYLNKSGLASLSSVTSYGEIKTAWPDRKVATVMAQDLNEHSQLWNISDKQQLWVFPLESENDKRVWVFDYYHGCWTQFQFPDVPVYAGGIDTRTYVFFNNSIYYLNDWYTQDELELDKPTEIKAKIRLGTLLRGLQTLIKSAFCSFSITPNGEAYLKLKAFKLPLTNPVTPVYIYGNQNFIYGYNLPLVSDGSISTARQRCIVRDWSITPEFEITGGGCSLNTAGFDIVEV